LRISLEGNKTLTIDPISFDLSSTPKVPVFALPDAKGLMPLELPTEFAAKSYAEVSPDVKQVPPPTPEAIELFRRAMATQAEATAHQTLQKPIEAVKPEPATNIPQTVDSTKTVDSTTKTQAGPDKVAIPTPTFAKSTVLSEKDENSHVESPFSPPPRVLTTEQPLQIVTKYVQAAVTPEEGAIRTSQVVEIDPEQAKGETKQVEFEPVKVAAMPKQIAPERIAAEPIATEPTKVVVEPAQVTDKPAQVTARPEQVAIEPTKTEPIAAEPAKVVVEPARVADKPAQVTARPEPIAIEPTKAEPIAAEPAKVVVEPTQVTDKPAQVTTRPEQVAIEPTKTEPIAAEPTKVVVEPARVTDKPAQVTARPEQVAIEPTKIEPIAAEPTKVVVEPVKVQVEPAQVQAEPVKIQVKPLKVVAMPEPQQGQGVAAPIRKEKAVQDELPVLQAVDSVPAAVVSAPPAAPTAVSATIEIDPAAASARTSEISEAVNAVAETIRVTPALERGDGEVVVRLKPTVLDGSEIRLQAKGSAVTIEIHPATPEVARAVERSQAEFAQRLSERMPSFQFAVSVTPRPTSFRKATVNEAD